MALLKFRRAMEVFLQPSRPTAEPVPWVDADHIRVRVGGQEIHIQSTKEGLEVTYASPKNKKGSISVETNSEGAKLRITP
jgi:hypothetical protein